MRKSDWKAKIKEQCRAAGTYAKHYESVIDTLAATLEQRDRTHAEFTASGGKSVIEYTNKAGATNVVKNPLLVLWMDLNQSALALWRDLGLTPKGYKDITGDKQKKPKESALAAALKSIED